MKTESIITETLSEKFTAANFSNPRASISIAAGNFCTGWIYFSNRDYDKVLRKVSTLSFVVLFKNFMQIGGFTFAKARND